MTKTVISKNLLENLEKFLGKHRKADLLTTYFYYLEQKFNIHPVLFIREKTIYQGEEEVLKRLESEGKLWRETEIKIQMGQPSVNSDTKKIYICPFTGKVFGNNTHPNPQDAIYDWVSKCPENTERIGGMKVKRFYVSEDPEVIKNYIKERKKPISKTVYSSVVTGKLFNSKASVIEDFRNSQLKSLPLLDVPAQNRYQIEENFLAFIQEQLEDAKISSFIEALSEEKVFAPFVERWMEENKEE